MKTKHDTYMKSQRVIIFIVALLAALSAAAAPPLRCERLLDGHYRTNPNASETIVSGKALKPYDLDCYHGLTIVDAPDEAKVIELAVNRDSDRAVDREVSYREGKLYYAFLTIKPEGKKNRYIFYLNQHLSGGNKIILIYMSGNAGTEKIKSMLKK